MLNKLTAVFSIIISGIVLGQSTSNNPYSSLGLGERGGFDHSFFSGVGNNTAVYCDSTVLNFYNPASYSYLTKHNPLFSTGVSAKLSKFSQNGISESSSLSSIDHFAFGFSFAKHFGLAFGLKPFSRRGYSLNETQPLSDGDSIRYTYSGEGSINQTFMGVSSDLVKYKNFRWTIGSNLSYLFGSTTNKRTSELVSLAGVGGADKKVLELKSFYYEIGTNFVYNLNKNNSFNLSVVYEPQQVLKASRNQTVYFTQNLSNENSYLELTTTGDQKGEIDYPSGLNAGLLYKYRIPNSDAKGNNRTSQLDVALSLKTISWSSFNQTFEGVTSNPGYENTTEINFGLAFIPELNHFINASTTTFLEKVTYRLGFYTRTLPYKVNSEQISDLGLGLGFGLPFTVGSSLSSVNIGVTFGERGSSDPSFLQEKYLGLNFGIIIAPTRADRWFVKRKLD